MIATSAHNSVINQAEDRLCRERLGLFIADDGYRCHRPVMPVMPVRSVGGRMTIARLRLKQYGHATFERALCDSNATAMRQQCDDEMWVSSLKSLPHCRMRRYGNIVRHRREGPTVCLDEGVVARPARRLMYNTGPANFFPSLR